MRRRVLVASFLATAFGCGLSLVGSDVVVDGGVDGSASLPPDGQIASDGSLLDSNSTNDGESDADGGGADDASDAMPTTDAPNEAAADGGALPTSTPGVVLCDGSVCNTATQFCCIGKGTCELTPAACGTYKEIECDEPLDCVTKCCLTRNSAEASNASTRCQADCSSSPGGVRVCRSSSDCNGNAPCIAVQCLGFTFGTCNGDIPPQCIDGGL